MTIVITTYRRPDFLLEALKSAVSQTFSGAFELLIVDNEPKSDSLEIALARIPELKRRNFRYYVHQENIGIFGNFNRSLELARADWVTILNDDDLLDPHCIETLYSELARYPDMDGIICEKRVLDQRAGAPQQPSQNAVQVPNMSWRLALAMLGGARGGWPELAKRSVDRISTELKYFGRSSRRINPKIFFFGTVLHNGVGYLFKRDAALSLGGFYPEEFPSADYFQFVRFASRYHFRQHRETAATFRLAENESAKIETILRGMEQALRLQRLMAGYQVPRWWLRLSPLVMALSLGFNRSFFLADLPTPLVEQRLGMRIPPERPMLLSIIRHILRGF